MGLKDSLKTLTGCAALPVMDVRKAAGGLLTVTSKRDNWLCIGEVEAEMSPHATLNTIKGLVVCRDLQSCTEKNITAELAPHGVVACRRIRMNRERQTCLLYTSRCV